jgi:hypothetical protein
MGPRGLNRSAKALYHSWYIDQVCGQVLLPAGEVGYQMTTCQEACCILFITHLKGSICELLVIDCSVMRKSPKNAVVKRVITMHLNRYSSAMNKQKQAEVELR